jgi:hypothetical protein
MVKGNYCLVISSFAAFALIVVALCAKLSILREQRMAIKSNIFFTAANVVFTQRRYNT